MPDPANLPAELFHDILDLALHGERDKQRLCRLALLNRKWNRALVDRIYGEWSYNGARRPFSTLWKFVRTMSSNAHLAALVRTLVVGNWGFYPRTSFPDPPARVQLPPDDSEVIRRAIRHTGLGEFEVRILESLSRRDRRPLMAILFASVPNLSSLHAHTAPPCPVLEAVFKRALGKEVSDGFPCPLQELKELYLFAEIPPVLFGDDDSEYLGSEASVYGEPDDISGSLKLESLWSVFYLPKLRTLSLFDIKPEDTAEFPGEEDAVSHVENLCLVGKNWDVLTAPGLEACLARTEGLKSLSLGIPLCRYEHPLHDSMITDAEAWDCLQKHRSKLESLDILDIYRESLGDTHFGLIRDVTRPKHLCIGIRTLLGGYQDSQPSQPAPFRLRDTLPTTIQTLTLYLLDDENPVLDISGQVSELLCGEFPSLTSITLEKVGFVVDEGGGLKEPYRSLEEICTEKGVVLRTEEPDRLPKGRSSEYLWAKTNHLRKDGEERTDAAETFPKRLRDTEQLLLLSAEDIYDEADYQDYVHSEDDEADTPPFSISMEFHTVPFTDHLGKSAYIVFRNAESETLPPLFSFAIYLTHPNAALETIDLYGLYEEIVEGLSNWEVRLDFYFLPSPPTYEDCITHYLGEKAKRGTYLRQIRMFKRRRRVETHPLPGTEVQVPGMVKKYGLYNTDHVLCVFPGLDWRERSQTMAAVYFDPRTYSSATPEYQVAQCPILAYANGISVVENRKRCIPGYRQRNDDAIGHELYDLESGSYEDWVHTWSEASQRGWKAW